MKYFLIIHPHPIKLKLLNVLLPPVKLIHIKDCEEALGFLSLHSQRINSLFISQESSFLNGVDLFLFLKANYAHIPVIIFPKKQDIYTFFNDVTTSNALATFKDFLILEQQLLINKTNIISD